MALFALAVTTVAITPSADPPMCSLAAWHNGTALRGGAPAYMNTTTKTPADCCAKVGIQCSLSPSLSLITES